MPDKKLLLIEPFYTDSHREWAEGLSLVPNTEVTTLGLEGRHWKWRMHGGAIELSEQWKKLDIKADALLATDMLDLGLFTALNRERLQGIPIYLYFHENQLTYPWSPTDQDKQLNRDRHYAFLNYSSALVADKVFFNSAYHRQSFLNALPEFLAAFPDYKGLEQLDFLEKKSEVLPLGLRLGKLDLPKIPSQDKHLILWNHRWEYDKNPEGFFHLLFELMEEGLDFEVAVLGKAYRKKPAIFEEARKRLGDRLIHYGYADSFAFYRELLWRATLMPVTSYQDFFGISVAEGMYAQTYPLLPNRLAYPEHLPPAFHSEHLYADDTELKEKLKACLQKPPLPYPPAQQWIERYDWSMIGQRYEEAFWGASTDPDGVRAPRRGGEPPLP